MKPLLKMRTFILVIILSLPLLSLHAKDSDVPIEEELIPILTRLSNLFLIPPMRADLALSFSTKKGFQFDSIDAYAEIVMTEQYIQELYKNEQYDEVTTTILAGNEGVVGNAHFFGENFLIDGVIEFTDVNGAEKPLEIKVILGERVLFHFFMEKMETKFVGLEATKQDLVISGKCTARSELLDTEELLNNNKVVTSNKLMKNCGFVYNYNKEMSEYEFKMRLNNK